MRRESYLAPDIEMILPRNSLPELRAVLGDDALGDAAESSLRLVDNGIVESNTDATPAAPLRPLLEQVLTELRSHRRRNARVVVKTGGKVMFLRWRD
jgi:hypothetical protein